MKNLKNNNVKNKSVKKKKPEAKKKFDVMNHWKSNLRSKGIVPKSNELLIKKKSGYQQIEISPPQQQEPVSQPARLPHRSPSPKIQQNYSSRKNLPNDIISIHSPDEYLLKNFMEMTKSNEVKVQIPKFMDSGWKKKKASKMKNESNGSSDASKGRINFESVSSTSLYNLTKDDDEMIDEEDDFIFIESKINGLKSRSIHVRKAVPSQESSFEGVKLDEENFEIAYLTEGNNSDVYDLASEKEELEYRGGYISGGSLIGDFDFESNGKYEGLVRLSKKKRENKIKA